MSSAITATWPMGVYLGHRRDGSTEDLPSFGRVFSALTHAAATGVTSRTESDGKSEEIPEDARKALEWLERNPPTKMLIPVFAAGRRSASIAYRKEGVFRLEGGNKNYKVTERLVGEGTALAGPVSWIWDEPFPQDIARSLDSMCADVGCLGEASSVVKLELDEGLDATHHLTKSRNFFHPGGIEVEVPSQGRLASLVRQNAEARPKKKPTEAADRHNTSAMPGSPKPSSTGLVMRRVVRIEEGRTPVPWDGAVAIPIVRGRKIRSDQRVGFALAVHRALISIIGTGAPSSVTGKYDDGVKMPANRVAVHYLPAGLPVSGLEDEDHLLILLPMGLPPSELDSLSTALQRLRTINSKFGRFELADDINYLAGDRFWAEPADGVERSWEISPAAIPERWAEGRTRRDVYRDTIAWSVGNVFKDLLDVELPRAVRKRRAMLEQLGLSVEWADPLVTRHPTRYVHRTNRVMPAMPYTGQIRLDGILPTSAIAAIGQSRHLGGGLLIPVDRYGTKEVADADNR